MVPPESDYLKDTSPRVSSRASIGDILVADGQYLNVLLIVVGQDLVKTVL
jgi:hypothetical protein